jgi:16S rRNA processing protein RimM
LGLVGAPFGLKGFVKVKPFSGETGHFTRLKKVTLKKNTGGKTSERVEKTVDVAETVIQGNVVLIRFAGIDSPEAAGSLRGFEITAGREFASPLGKGEFYIEDLKGLEVRNAGGETLGRIISVVEGGGGNLAEVALLTGEKRFAPFRNEFFGEVDMEKGQIILLEPWILE